MTSSESRRKFDGPSPEKEMVRDLIKLLEAGTTPWRKPWDCTGGGVHVNLLTGRAYRGSNPILLELGMAMRGPASEPITQSEQILGAWPHQVRWGAERAFYVPTSDQIQPPERQSFHGAAELYATWGYKASHSTGHKARLKRDLSGGFGSRSYAREELVAELGSVLMGQRLQIGCELTNHAANLESWISSCASRPRCSCRSSPRPGSPWI
ncbi:zincin-like metallopeptidase domain-containing protein [Synechococcus sp. J7-Johnson]|uniref:zincin-like metallopeptidase domain-containing protein n=1 Tax=Synechococcus sp. J7-Johnson TaxID=2823737 RepID=UPI0020CC3AF1|nr:zincin-like metallopeptidase domain-containing protein [Synechococcus sp. J7-Johnson]